ncbi:mannosyltransferase [Apophysomyces ossiformis]|uniref:Chitobiosyldiphosphodolichol beta-mannosyltransferase n=1 Tax=Apophysomyces ossiformis TaxID=679940 RepID=A0A8H7EU66_9FUNG|nr:mannosyltransferase [Apophysomyces ossiformis]
MVELADSGNFSLGGVLLAILCIYVLGGRILRIYMFGSNGSFMQRHPVVQVVVLGDIGRSPRMRYHAVSLADAGCTVDLIGYSGKSVTLSFFYGLPLIDFTFPPLLQKRIQEVGSSPIDASVSAVFVKRGLYPKNPPALPTLIIARFIAFARQAWLIIDWHNFGYSILGVKLGHRHPVVRFSKWYEKLFGSKAYAHLTVTDRMHKELVTWGVEGKLITFKDRPQAHFQRLSTDRIHKFLLTCRLQDIVKGETLDADTFLGRMDQNGTLLTQDIAGTISLRPDRPRLIVSSTSWTEDEDFSILLRAVEEYEKRAKDDFPNLLFVITGKGPLKSYYEEKISLMRLRKARIITAWLEAHEYPLLLGSADLGISLHTSSSGMDLPMKVVDMFGCGLPVCAVSFECLDELVTDNRNGLIFNTSEELANQLVDLFVTEPERISELRTNVIAEYTEKTWEKQHKDLLSELFNA